MKNERERRTLPSASAARTVLGDLMPLLVGYRIAASCLPGDDAFRMPNLQQKVNLNHSINNNRGHEANPS